MPAETRQRLEKWLWFARLVKTRAFAAALVSAGQVRVNRNRITKPGHAVGPGDTLTIALHGQVRVVRIIVLALRRGPPEATRTQYEDLADPAAHT